MSELMHLYQVTGVSHSGLGQPVITKQEVRDRKISSISGINDVVTRPRDSVDSARTRSSVVKLRIIQSAKSKITVPFAPPSRIDDNVHKALHENRPGVIFPGPSEISFSGIDVRSQIIGWSNRAVVDGSARVLIWVGSSLCGDGVELATHWKARIDVTVLEHCRGVSEYEIYGAVDVAFPVELSQGMGVQCVLVSFEAAAVKRGQICAVSECYRLVLLCSGSVADGHIYTHEPCANHRCNVHNMITSFY